MQAIKLIALDLDGTLLNSDKLVSDANAAAVGEALMAGYHVILASGRMHSATAKYAISLSFPPDSFVISYNGGLVRSISDETLLEEPLDATSASYLVRLTKERGLHLNYYLDDILYVARDTEWSKLYQERTGSIPHAVGDLGRFDGKQPTKLVIVDHKETLDRLMPEMKSHFGSSVTVLKTDDEYLEFNASEANKAVALAAVADSLRIKQSECLALGDGYNDLPMLEWAGIGVAMGNGRSELLRQIVEHAPPANDDGVASVLRRLLAGTLATAK